MVVGSVQSVNPAAVLCIHSIGLLTGGNSTFQRQNLVAQSRTE